MASVGLVQHTLKTSELKDNYHRDSDRLEILRIHIVNICIEENRNSWNKSVNRYFKVGLKIVDGRACTGLMTYRVHRFRSS